MSFFSRMFIGTDREFAGIEMDAIIREQYDLSSQITDHPVDEGSEISDNIILSPRVYVMEAIVTDTPMGLLAALEQIGQTVSTVINYLKDAVLDTETENDATSRSLAAFQALVSLWEERSTFDVQTGMGLWQNMAILNIRVMVDQETAGKLHFYTTLRQVRKVKLVTSDDEAAPALEEGEIAEGGEPVKKEGLKQKVTKLVDSVEKSVRDFFA
jgi:hypothetical protein